MRAAFVLLFAFLATAAQAAPQSNAWYGSGGYGSPGQVVRCESRDGLASRCPMDTSQGVRLVRQVSGSACVQGRTWGYDRDGVWVSGGCRGDFASYYNSSYYGGYGAYGNRDDGYYGNGDYGDGGYADPYAGGYDGRNNDYGNYGSASDGNGLIRCDSTEGRLRRCAADTRGGVEIVRQISGASCIRGRTWGWDDRGVWVDGGCRAEFRPTYGQGRLVRCESIDGRFRECAAGGRGGARLVRQLSGSACVEGRTWGSRRGSVWVDGGCRGDFLLDVRGGAYGDRNGYGYGYDTGGARTVRCTSDDGRTRRCGVAARDVRLQRQLSDSPCLSGQTWGWDRAGIWVTNGCRADFAVR